MATEIIITGDKALDAKLSVLKTSVAQKLAKYALQAMASKLAAAIRKEAPVGPTKNLKKLVGSRVVLTKDGIITAKVGLNVGKKTVKRKGRLAPHAHLVALGTEPRFRQTIGGRYGFYKNPTQQEMRTGVMPANPFVRFGVASGMSSARAAMMKNATKNLAKELAKLKT